MPPVKPLPCPLCGGTRLTMARWGGHRITVACEDCNFDGPEGACEGSATVAWNRRAGLPEGCLVIESEQFDKLRAVETRLYGDGNPLTQDARRDLANYLNLILNGIRDQNE